MPEYYCESGPTKTCPQAGAGVFQLYMVGVCIVSQKDKALIRKQHSAVLCERPRQHVSPAATNVFATNVLHGGIVCISRILHVQMRRSSIV